jgi:hypothetical protein
MVKSQNQKHENKSSKPQAASQPRSGQDPTLEYMKKKGIRLTRENYLALDYVEPNPVLGEEQEAQLPPEFRKKTFSL